MMESGIPHALVEVGMEEVLYTVRGQAAAATHALCWQRDWMQISRRRRSRGRGGPLLGCSVSAAGSTSRRGHVCAGKARVAGAPPPRPGPHPRAEWQREHRSQPLVRCTGR